MCVVLILFFFFLERWLYSDPMSCLVYNFLLASLVICMLLCLKILHIFFFDRFYLLGRFCAGGYSSSLYNPTLTSRWVSWDKRNSPTSSQVSAPSKIHIVTSKSDFIFRHGNLLLKRVVPFVCLIVTLSSVVIFM